MAATRPSLPSSRLPARSARLLNVLLGAGIALGLADLLVLGGVRISSQAVGTVALPLATALVAAGLAALRLVSSRGDRLLWLLLSIALGLSLAGMVVSALTGSALDHTGVAAGLRLGASPPRDAGLVVGG